ncbi:Spore germination protein GerM [Streptomyces sp. 3213]|uniref:GerMN domain-containing protein n=1 Tax=Streptomyces sp. 3213.3 TaxID=1855348 RepID=UPI000895C272|nr:GerMN domain-containing protein [Streptomyces sp. 3213.3]SEC75756.1 Spore germination protein GerM [Streptomyces sp. 3213] [Streptomyces sp. 3213.3]
MSEENALNSTSVLPSRSHRCRSTVLTAAVTLPVLAVTACGTTTGPAGQGGTAPTSPPTVGTGTSGGTSGAPAPSGTTTPETTAAPTAAVRALLADPDRYEQAHGRTTAIPSGTRLSSLVVRNHVATVDLSARYEDGGGSLSLRERIAQVVFTVTRFPTVHKVAFEVDGKAITSSGSAGLALNGPVGRADFEDRAPAVLVESPMIGDTVRTPLRVWGSADTFEARFRLKVTDTTGRTAADVMVKATSGTGTRGTFDVMFPYKAARTGPGVLTAYVLSAKDGRAVPVDTVPLTVNR